MNITTNKSVSSSDEKLSQQNNDKVANTVSNILTSCVVIGSCFLFYSLNSYMTEIQAKYPNYKFPSCNDYILAILLIPVLIVIYTYK